MNMIEYYVVYDFTNSDGARGSGSVSITRLISINNHEDIEALSNTIKSKNEHEMVMITNIIRLPI